MSRSAANCSISATVTELCNMFPGFASVWARTFTLERVGQD